MNTLTSNPAAALTVAHHIVAERMAHAEARAQARALRAQPHAIHRPRQTVGRSAAPALLYSPAPWLARPAH